MNLPINGIKRESDGEFGFLKSEPEFVHVLGRINPGHAIPDGELRRFHVAKNGDNPLLALHHESQLVQAKIRIAILRRENGDPDLAVPDRRVDFLEKLVAGLHVLAVQERPEPEPPQVVVKQPGDVPLRVNPPVVNEHVAWRNPLRPKLAPVPENLIAQVLGCR